MHKVNPTFGDDVDICGIKVIRYHLNRNFSSPRAPLYSHLQTHDTYTMKPSTTLVRLASQSTRPTSQICRASSSQAGPSTPAPSATKKSKRLPKSVLRDLVKLHHTSSSFMHDPSQLPHAFEIAFRAGVPEYTKYEDFHNASHLSRQDQQLVEYDPTSPSGTRSGSSSSSSGSRIDNIIRSKDIVPTFGFVEEKWSDAGARAFAVSERDKQVREALFGTFERGPGESIKPALEGVEEWLEKEGRSVDDVAKEWEARHEEVSMGQKDGQ